MTIVRACGSCGGVHPPGQRCPNREARRNERPKARAIWHDWRWRNPKNGTRARVLRRDGYTCQRCGRHRDKLRQNETLIAHHETYERPFDPATCVTVCSTCSGELDGGRRAAA